MRVDTKIQEIDVLLNILIEYIDKLGFKMFKILILMNTQTF